MRLIELAELIDGRVVGNPDLEISGAASVDRAGEGEISFATDQKRFERFLQGQGCAALIPEALFDCQVSLNGKSVVCCDAPEEAFARIVACFRPAIVRNRVGISPAANVSPNATISDNVDIHPGACVGDGAFVGSGTTIHSNVVIMENVRIGKDVQLFPGAVLYENTIVGDRCIIHAGAVLGAFGFGYRSNAGQHRLSPQLGNVVLEDDVEVGANTTIDRGTYESTVIGRGSKLDNLVMIGHNCTIGQHNLLCSQVGIAGSSSTGDFVVMGGQVGVGDHLAIGDGAMLCAQSGVMHDLDGNQTYAGAPAVPARISMQQHALIARLPELRSRLKNLERASKQWERAAESNATSNRSSDAKGEASTGRPAGGPEHAVDSQSNAGRAA